MIEFALIAVFHEARVQQKQLALECENCLLQISEAFNLQTGNSKSSMQMDLK